MHIINFSYGESENLLEDIIYFKKSKNRIEQVDAFDDDDDVFICINMKFQSFIKLQNLLMIF